MSKTRIALVVIAIVIVLGGVLSLSRFLARDKCLDSGGSWNAAMRVCER